MRSIKVEKGQDGCGGGVRAAARKAKLNLVNRAAPKNASEMSGEDFKITLRDMEGPKAGFVAMLQTCLEGRYGEGL